jgi:hypothetical protein
MCRDSRDLAQWADGYSALKLDLLEDSELRRLASSIDFLYTSRLLGMSAIKKLGGGIDSAALLLLEIRNNVGIQV